MEYERPPYRITLDIKEFDTLSMYRFLTEDSYWGKGLTLEEFDRGLKNSLCFGLFDGNQQIGMGRVITDYATFAYLKDVFVLPSHQGLGLGKWIMECIMNYPSLEGIARWQLQTLDAQWLYRRLGFVPLDYPRFHMEKVRPVVEMPKHPKD